MEICQITSIVNETKLCETLIYICFGVREGMKLLSSTLLGSKKKSNNPAVRRHKTIATATYSFLEKKCTANRFNTVYDNIIMAMINMLIRPVQNWPYYFQPGFFLCFFSVHQHPNADWCNVLGAELCCAMSLMTNCYV